jgi:hypothetical protein
MINKSTLTSVISKYYLNGLNNQVKWRIKDNQLTIYAGESGRVCKIEHNNFPLEDAELGVFDTHKLSKLISITNGDLMVSLEKVKAVYTKMHFADISKSGIEIPFDSDIFKDILNSNKDMDSGTLKLSEQGMLKLNFYSEEVNSEYFIARNE